MVTLDPEWPIAKQLKASLVVELGKRFQLADDAEDVAEYIVVLISSNKTPSEIAREVKELVDIPIDEGFVETIYSEINRLMGPGGTENKGEDSSQGSAAVAAVAAAPAPPLQQMMDSEQEQNQDQNQNQDLMEDDKPAGEVRTRDFPANLPSGPRGFQARRGRGNSRGGIQKNGRVHQKKSFAMQNEANLEKVLAVSNSSITNLKPFVQKAPKGRCNEFPYCSNKECQLSHPTKLCFAFPNCANAPGTCNYLHPGEDDDLMKKLEKSRQEYIEKKKHHEAAGTIGICKYGMLCSKEICPFGHPTPANKEAKVLLLQWCAAGKACQDASCTKAHPSPNYQPPPPEAKPKPKLTLEQCKFGPACTNFKCPRRHATTPVPCNDGASCTRIDCFFLHPIDEDCRFGTNCTNRNCMFRHPEGRNITNASNTWTKDSGNPTSQRSFAVPEDQVMEQAVQEN